MLSKASFVFATATALLSPAQAATLTNITSGGIGNGGSVNLTTAGTLGWAAWDLGDGVTNGATSYAANFTKAGGIGTYGAITRIGASGNLRGPTSDNSSNVFTWSDATGGATPPADNRVSGVFSTVLNTANSGVQFTLSNLPALTGGDSYLITLYGYNYGSRSIVTATNGTTTVTQLSLNVTGATRTTERYQFSYNPDSAADVLTLSNAQQAAGSDGSSHAAIQAVSISIVPEASSAVMALGGATALLFRRKRRI